MLTFKLSRENQNEKYGKLLCATVSLRVSQCVINSPDVFGADMNARSPLHQDSMRTHDPCRDFLLTSQNLTLRLDRAVNKLVQILKDLLKAIQL